MKGFDNKDNQQPQFATINNAKKIESKIKLTKMQDYDEELQKLQSCLRVEQERLRKENKKPPVD